MSAVLLLLFHFRKYNLYDLLNKVHADVTVLRGDFLQERSMSFRGFVTSITSIQLLNERKKKETYCHVLHQANIRKGAASIYHVDPFFF